MSTWPHDRDDRGAFEQAIHDHVEPRCPYCGELPPMIEQIGHVWFCQTCGQSWAATEPAR